MQPKHQKVTKYRKTDEGVEIHTKSYYEQLAHELVEIEKPTETSFYTLKKDVEMALSHVLEEGTPKLTLTIENKKGKMRLIKKWVSMKQSYPRQ